MAWICHSGRPTAAAVVAAPMRNEWLAKVVGSAPVDLSRVRRCEVRAVRVRKDPSWNWKRGVDRRTTAELRYFLSAATGQVEVCVAPTVTVQPFRKGSVLEDLRRSWAKVGARERSTRHRECDWSNEWAEGGTELVGSQEAVKCCAECCPQHEFVVEGDGLCIM